MLCCLASQHIFPSTSNEADDGGKGGDAPLLSLIAIAEQASIRISVPQIRAREQEKKKDVGRKKRKKKKRPSMGGGAVLVLKSISFFPTTMRSLSVSLSVSLCEFSFFVPAATKA